MKTPKVLIILITILMLGSKAIAQDTSDLDSMFYADVDTTGYAKSMAEDEKEYLADSAQFVPAVDYSQYLPVDNYVLQFKKQYKSIPELAKDLTLPYTSEADKVRIIFRWITENIAYDVDEYHNKDQSIGGKKPDNWADDYFDYASNVLRKKKGVCEGYAQLFYELCKCNGIKCQVIDGKVGEEKNGRISYYGHAWNKVSIDSKWYYLDVTWASGYCDDKVTAFTKLLANDYYITSIDKPFKSHIENVLETKRRNELIGN